MIEKIDHIGIVVGDIDEAIGLYRDSFDLNPGKIEEMEELNLKLVFVPVGDTMIEFIEPTGPGNYMDFLKEHGQGFHHICFKVPDISLTLQKLSKTLKLIDKKPRPGGDNSLIAFIDPSSVLDVETELVQR